MLAKKGEKKVNSPQIKSKIKTIVMSLEDSNNIWHIMDGYNQLMDKLKAKGYTINDNDRGKDIDRLKELFK